MRTADAAADAAVAPVDATVGDASATTPPAEIGRVILILSLVAFGSAGSVRIMDAAIPRLAADFTIGIQRASYAVTVCALFYGAFQIVFGPAGDRYGKLRVVHGSCVAAAVASLACALAPSFGWLLVARAATGIAAASMLPLSMAWIGDHVGYADRQAVLARFLIGQMAGVAMGQAVGGLAADLASWRLPPFLLALWFVLAALLIAAPARRASRASRGDARPRVGLVVQCRSVLALPWARRLLAIVFFEGAALYGPFAFFVTHLHVKHGVGLGLAGGTVVAFAVGGVAYALCARRLVGRLGETGLARVGSVLMAAGIALVALGPVAWPTTAFAIPGFVATGLGFYMLHNTLQINATQMAPHARGTAVALFAATYFFGQGAGVAIGGHVVERYGTTTWLATGAVALVVIGWTFAAMRARRTIAPARSADA